MKIGLILSVLVNVVLTLFLFLTMNSNHQRVLELMSKNQEIVNVNDSLELVLEKNGNPLGQNLKEEFSNDPQGFKRYCEKQGLKGCSYSNGFFIDGEKNIYKYGDGTFLWDKEKTDSRRQQQGGTQQGGTEKEKPKRRTADDL